MNETNTESFGFRPLTAKEQLERLEAVSYKRGYEKGWGEAMRVARRGYHTLRTMEYVIAFLLGVAISIGLANIANAEEVETTVTVTVTAEVECNPQNCPEPGDKILCILVQESERGWWWTVKDWLLSAW